MIRRLRLKFVLMNMAFVTALLAAVFMGLWCNLFFHILLDGGWGEGWAAACCALLGLVLYAAALLAQGLSVTVVFARFRTGLWGRRCAP